ncbi:MAG: MarR family transcriptional regulator [Candidatus Acidiferrales bacterium]
MSRRRYISRRERTSRAYVAYMDLVAAAEHLREEMSRQLAMFNLTPLQYRVLETLYRYGPQYQPELNERFRCSKQNVARVVKILESGGSVRRSGAPLPPTTTRGWVNPNGARSMKRPETGRRIVLVRLTQGGKDLMKHLFPKHAKVVKAEMKVLDGREQMTLIRLCRRLQSGDAVRFLKELMVKEEWE